jgi:hypothetical protein
VIRITAIFPITGGCIADDMIAAANAPGGGLVVKIRVPAQFG